MKKCYLQSDNLAILIFMNKNNPTDAKMGCKAPGNLVELIDFDIRFKIKIR
jgi:hypothetical protein